MANDSLQVRSQTPRSCLYSHQRAGTARLGGERAADRCSFGVATDERLRDALHLVRTSLGALLAPPASWW